ncbi:hypothetical protein ACNF42_07510 [Cuniculiplasma sp. SKW3]|uniref:hypothetical protein n=1 Tax=Cuniculiplasma sp. SKW3 TaxID=3400170 RepID=UPI003FD5CEC9
MAFSGRFTRWVPLLIVAVVDFLVLFSVLYFVPSSSPYYTPLYYIVDALTFAAVVLTAQSIRFKTGFGRKIIYRSNTTKPNFIYSNIVDDSDSDIYKQKLKEASDLYLQGKINSDEEFFTVIGEHTPKEDRILRALKGAREEFEKMGRR